MIGLRKCAKKIDGASKFIDYFVHDILDYTILSKDELGFIKQCTVFDINKAIEELLEIQEDKILMKEIQIKTSFEGFTGFEGRPMIKTD